MGRQGVQLAICKHGSHFWGLVVLKIRKRVFENHMNRMDFRPWNAALTCLYYKLRSLDMAALRERERVYHCTSSHARNRLCCHGNSHPFVEILGSRRHAALQEERCERWEWLWPFGRRWIAAGSGAVQCAGSGERERDVTGMPGLWSRKESWWIRVELCIYCQVVELEISCNVGIAIINHPFLMVYTVLYHPFMVIRWMVYDTAIATLIQILRSSQ